MVDHMEAGIEGKDQIIVFFPSEQKLNNDHMIDFLKKMDSDEIVNGIIVYKQDITSSAKKTINENDSFLNIELFNRAEV
jgi:hypothetical protein